MELTELAVTLVRKMELIELAMTLVGLNSTPPADKCPQTDSHGRTEEPNKGRKHYVVRPTKEA